MSEPTESKPAKWADMKTPFPKTKDELIGIIDSILSDKHDYESCAESIAVAMAAVTNFLGSTLAGGCSGFQVSFATLRGFGRIRNMDCPFAVIHAGDMLFPQYDITSRVAEYIEEWKWWARVAATKNMTETSKDDVHPTVWERWEKLANWKAESEASK